MIGVEMITIQERSNNMPFQIRCFASGEELSPQRLIPECLALRPYQRFPKCIVIMRNMLHMRADFLAKLRRWHRCKNNCGWSRACESSSLASKVELLLSPARPRPIIATNRSLPSHGAGFLAMIREYIAHIERLPLQAAGTQPGGAREMRMTDDMDPVQSHK